MIVYGDLLLDDTQATDFKIVETLLKRPVVYPQFRISVLNPDETLNYIIPSEDIPSDGIQFTEEYQSGQRRNITLTLINSDGKYTPSINGLWLTTKFKFEIGIRHGKEVIWFPRGIYVFGDVDLTNDKGNRTIQIQLKDKFSIFEDKLGTLADPYEIPVDSDIYLALKGILNFSLENGYIMDYQQIVMSPELYGSKTQATIRVEEGGNLGELISQLATQLSAEYYYNNTGNLCFYSINETLGDDTKPIIWNYTSDQMEIHNMSLNYKNVDAINVVKVVGDNITSGISYAIAENTNPASSICIQQIGRRTMDTVNDSNIWSNDLAQDLANYHLRKNSFLAIDFSAEVGFNPCLIVNNLVELEEDFLGLEREKLLITSISYGSGDGAMNLKLCNTRDLPTNHRRK